MLQEQLIDIEHDLSIIDLELLIRLIVKQQVNLYNSKTVDQEGLDATHTPVYDYLSQLMETGKVGFGNRYNPNSADLKASQEEAIQAFKDGLFAVFYGEEEISELSGKIDLSLNKTFTFIRLTFLAGSYW